VRSGLLVRTPRGRVATPAGWRHLGLTPPRPGSGVGPEAETATGTLFDP